MLTNRGVLCCHLGVGLAMDAFSVSLANGLHEPYMKRNRIFAIAGVYAFFQYIMPMIGWICVHTIVEAFSQFRQFIPWIALLLLLYIGGKMILEGLEERKADEEELAAQDPRTCSSRASQLLSTRFPWALPLRNMI